MPVDLDVDVDLWSSLTADCRLKMREGTLNYLDFSAGYGPW